MKAAKQILLATCLFQLALPAFAEIAMDVSLPETAKPGQDVRVSVKTDAKIHCKIEAQDAGLTQILKLTEKDTDNAGTASWDFRIPENYKADKMPVIITVSRKGEEAQTKCIKDIEIKK